MLQAKERLKTIKMLQIQLHNKFMHILDTKKQKASNPSYQVEYTGYLLIDEINKLLQSLICNDPTIQRFSKLFYFSFKTTWLLSEMV